MGRENRPTAGGPDNCVRPIVPDTGSRHSRRTGWAPLKGHAHGDEAKVLCPWGLPHHGHCPFPVPGSRAGRAMPARARDNRKGRPGLLATQAGNMAFEKGQSGAKWRGPSWTPEKQRPRWVWVPLSPDWCGLMRSPQGSDSEPTPQIRVSLGTCVPHSDPDTALESW